MRQHNLLLDSLRRAIIIVTVPVMTVVTVASLHAQSAPTQSTPSISSAPTPRTPDQPAPGLITTPGEQGHSVNMYPNAGLVTTDGYHEEDRPRVIDLIHERARTWMDAVDGKTIAGIQLDAMGSLAVLAGRDSIAQRAFATRLATPGLSIEDRTYTLVLAVSAFADAKIPARMQVARAYLPKIDALPEQSQWAKVMARFIIGDAYYVVAEEPEAIQFLADAFRLVPSIPYARRDWQAMTASVIELGDLYSGQPNGRHLIDSMTTWLHPLYKAPLEHLKEPPYISLNYYTERMYNDFSHLLGYLGRPAIPIAAQFWLNTTAPSGRDPHDSTVATKPLNDGMIHLLEVGDYGCPGCRLALPMMERIRKSVPKGVELWFVSNESEQWGATFCTPSEKVAHLSHYYVTKKHYGLPIAIWIGKRTPDVDGGSLPQLSPTSAAYALATPTFVLVDGHGIIRHIGIGDSEEPLRQRLQFLIAEAAREHANEHASAPVTTSSHSMAALP